MSAAPNFYGMGAATVGESTFGPFDVRMPGAIRDEIVTIDKNFGAMNRMIVDQAAKLPADFNAGWRAIYSEWQTFQGNHSTWVSNVWYASYQKALEYRKRLDDWRLKFEQLVGTKINYPTPGPTAGPPAPAGGFPWKFVLYTGGGIAALWGISKVLASTTELKRELVGSRTLAVSHD